MRFFGIYKITNLVNGKMYIGQHVTDDLDDGYMGSGVVILRALKKYGRDNFRKEWLMFCEDEEELGWWERVFVDETWIARSDTYNLIPGDTYKCGRGRVAWNKGIPWSEESKRKMSVAHAGKKLSAATKLKIGRASKGRKPFAGKRHSEDSKRLMSQSQVESWTDERRETQRQRASGVVFSDDRKRKIGSAIKGRRWWNNGEISVMRKECPPGFIPGMLKKGAK